jgi:hypothetical protein
MSFSRIAPREKAIMSAGRRRHVGELVVRRLSRIREFVTGVSPYIPCMLAIVSRPLQS